MIRKEILFFEYLQLFITLEFKTMESHVLIRVKTIDNKITDFSLNISNKVLDLKQAIQEKLNIPVDKQRLIYQGRLMENSDSFSKIKFESGFVVHLIAQQQQQQPNQIEESQQASDQEHEIQGIASDLEMLRGILRAIRQTTEQRQNLRRFMMQQRGNGFSHNFDEVQEVIAQSFLNIKQMVNCAVATQELTPNEFQTESYVNPFKFHKRKLKIGQWVDVQDTIEQWLEAQVLDQKDGKVFVHYNGWGNRWDEWIDVDSPRIALFRTYTTQSQNSEYLSPVPQNDAEGELLTNGEFDFTDFVFEIGFVMSQVTTLVMKLGNYLSHQRLQEKQSRLGKSIEALQRIKGLQQFEEEAKDNSSEELQKLKIKSSLMSSQISPLFDRLGRMMIDMAPRLAVEGQETQRMKIQSASVQICFPGSSASDSLRIELFLDIIS